MNFFEDLCAQKCLCSTRMGLKDEWIKWRNEWPFSSSVHSFMEPQVTAVTGGDVLGEDGNMDKHGCISGWSEQRVYVFFALEKIDFFFLHIPQCYLLNENLRDFSPCWLQPSLNFACFSLLKARIEAFLHMLGLQVFFFLFVPSLLPTVTDPFSVIIRLYIFFVLFKIHLVIVMQIWISAKRILVHLSFPLLVYNKALREGVKCLRTP